MDTHSGHGAPTDDELDPDEPRTPLWLPLLGLGLFLSLFAYALANQKAAPPAEASAPAAAPSASAAPN